MVDKKHGHADAILQATDNLFSTTSAGVFSSLIRIARPGVTIHNNLFIANQPHLASFGIDLFNPPRDSGPFIDHIVIAHNRFKVSMVIGNHLGEPHPVRRVKINNNVFSQSLGVLPITSADGIESVTPKSNIDVAKNVWGKLDVNNVSADTRFPLDNNVPPPNNRPTPMPDSSLPPVPAPQPGPSAPSFTVTIFDASPRWKPCSSGDYGR